MLNNRMFPAPTLTSYEKKLLQCVCVGLLALECINAQQSNSTSNADDSYFLDSVLGMPRYGFLLVAFTGMVMFGLTVLASMTLISKCRERCAENDYADELATKIIPSRFKHF